MPETTKNKKNIGAREERDGSQKKRNSDGEAVNKDPTGKKKQKLKNTESIAAPKDSAQPLTVTASGSEAKKSEIDDLFGQLKAKKSKPVPPPAEAEVHEIPPLYTTPIYDCYTIKYATSFRFLTYHLPLKPFAESARKDKQGTTR